LIHKNLRSIGAIHWGTTRFGVVAFIGRLQENLEFFVVNWNEEENAKNPR
jgi:hypothetical protein